MVNRQMTADRETTLPLDDLTALRDHLLEQRLFREAQLQQLAGATAPGSDAGLDRQTASHREVHIKLADAARMVLADVEAALTRMDQGTYGACHLCRKSIDPARLAIVPQARYCARCQHVREAGL
ncbi:MULTISPECIES: TraR/DksA C4-type zinc finger protein [unclassified Streptomyces]|uniref:TraR/DksA family transcriptional regulator n=1 Tax=unclassified Streptomyces TaxID=2593676 RepID=UPI00341B1E59